MEVDGTLQKNGGNVATCFCIPDGRVIHAVGGPVSAERLRDEALWAVTVYKQIREYAPDDLDLQMQLVEEAHLAALRATPDAYYRACRRHLVSARPNYHRVRQIYAVQSESSSSESRYGRQRYSVLLRARYEAAKSFEGDQAHQLFASQPLPPFLWARGQIFSDLSGQKLKLNRELVYDAAERVRRARDERKPIVLVLYHGSGHNKERYDSHTERLMNWTFARSQASEPLQGCEIVTLPSRQLAAFTQLTELPEYEIRTDILPCVSILGPDGQRIETLNGEIEPAYLARRLWPLVSECALEQSAQLVERGELLEALRALQRVADAPVFDALHDRITDRIAAVTFQLAEDSAAGGRTDDALRLFRRVQSGTRDADLRRQAGEQIALLEWAASEDAP